MSLLHLELGRPWPWLSCYELGHTTRPHMISFIVPAHNEEAWVGRCVSAIRNGAESLGEPHEIIVVDDGSSDATASIG